ncbi:GDSL esterase/lipase [Senna tora]|uniref:GDSL esterase/lipase n=1 Tax=Senna tora TaxID=362788 RepID=A0A834VZF7_9FABA|nr:GDSL esterase/lipase [Senna tora]
MGYESKVWVLVALAAVWIYMGSWCVEGEGDVPCMFVFGDSLSDNGNNNDLSTLAKANYLPYGIDFPSGPTGRFTNGRTSVDFISEFLGFEKMIPPFANTSGSDILQGVNYASGASGIRTETGTHLGANIRLGSQIANHRAIVSEIARKLGNVEKAQNYLNKCLYYINIGSNDYINNYFLPQHYPTSTKYTPQDYAVALIQEYSQHLRALHGLGSRKFALFGLHLLGCIPYEMMNHGEAGSLCVKEENSAALVFNDKLKALVDRFNQEFSDSKFIYINNAIISSETPNVSGNIVKGAGCCETRADGMCAPKKEACIARKLHLFWDSIHPSESANLVLATFAYKSPIPTYAHPMDISHLVNL